jgi:hypothetical protein
MAADILLPLRFADLDQPKVGATYLHYIVERADIVCRHSPGRQIMRFEFAAEPWLLEKRAAVGATGEGLEDAAK